MHRLTTPKTPDAWLLVTELPSGELMTYSIHETPEEAEKARDELFSREYASSSIPGSPVAPSLTDKVIRDSPGLSVAHVGISIRNAACLSARDNWFLRHWDFLKGIIGKPKVATIFTYRKGLLIDPLQSYRAGFEGPCALPEGTPWPQCPRCREPMAFVGVLDFRFPEAGPAPRGSLVLHRCLDWECNESWSLVWIMPGDKYRLTGPNLTSDVLVGQAWQTTDYECDLDALDDAFHSKKPKERSVYFNPCSVGDKVGGHFHFIQHDTPLLDSRNEAMICIGQITESEYMDLGDFGSGYIYWSPRTGETKIDVQGY